MSQDFGIDNAGSGFDFDDEEEDIEAMFNRANEGEENDDDNDSHLAYIYSDGQKETTSASYASPVQEYEDETGSNNNWEVVPQEEQVLEEHEGISSNIPTYDSTTIAPETTDYQNFEEYTAPYEKEDEIPEENTPIAVPQPPVERQQTTGRRIASKYNSAYSSHSAVSANKAYETAVPAPVVPAPAPIVAPAPVSYENTPRKFNITTEQEDIESVRKTIRILDAYRKLNSKTIVAQLIYNENEVDPKDEAALVVKVLRADPMLGRMMTVLRESASEKDRVERVFYILNTDQDLLRYLGSFLETVSDVTFAANQDHIAFAKEVERTIEGLDNKIVQHVADAQSVLVAAEDEKE